MLKLFALCLGAFLSNLSASLLNVALLDISEEFHLPLNASQWVITSYLLTITVFLPIMGKIGDRCGKRVVHNSGYLLFAMGALLCALSPSFPLLLAFRVVQGIGASMYQATNIALIIALQPPEHRGRSLGYLTTAVAAGSLLGPGLGGIIVQWFEWRVLFWILVPLASMAYVLAQRFIPKDSRGESGQLDLLGAALFTFSSGALVAGLAMGNEWGWETKRTIALFLFAFICFSLFLLRSFQVKEPFIPMEIFFHPMVRHGIFISILSYMVVFSMQVVVPIYLRDVIRVSPAVTGFILMSYPLFLTLMGPVGGMLSDRLGAMPVVCSGLLSMGVSLIGLSFLSSTSSLYYIGFFVALLGGSMGLVVSPNNSFVMNHSPEKYLGIMSSVMALSRNLGMVFGAVAGVALIHPWLPEKSDRMETFNDFIMDAGQNVMNGLRTVFFVSAALILTAVLKLWHLTKKFEAEHSRRHFMKHNFRR
ncbi:MFS transporter [Anoxybacillus geothermalis]|nr:Multidrug resistance protein stp [Geobacillus sp. 12AMOR1]MED4923974.1 MFS transporter [Anoxybacillus geothermalis]